jgi:hypothetical protein
MEITTCKMWLWKLEVFGMLHQVVLYLQVLNFLQKTTTALKIDVADFSEVSVPVWLTIQCQPKRL